MLLPTVHSRYRSLKSLVASYLGLRNLEARFPLTVRTDNGTIRMFAFFASRVVADHHAYRYAWPPHQIMAWVGFERYGYLEEAQRLAYRFIYM